MKSVRQVLLVLTLVAITAVLGACSGQAEQPGGASAAGLSSSASAPAVEVDEGLLSVDVAIRRSLIDPEGELTDEQIIQSAKDNGMAAVVNDDTVTYTMTRKQQQEMLDRMRASIQESTDELVNDASNSFTDIGFNDDLTAFTVEVDGQRYSVFESFYAVVLFVGGGLFQQFSGVEADDLDVEVQFVDNASGEVLESGSLRDWLDQQEQQPD